MSEYRDELAAAHARITQLEEELGRRPKPTKASRAPWIAVAVALLFAGSCGSASWLAVRRGSEVAVRPVAYATPAPVPATHRLYASWYPTTRVTPEVVDVNGETALVGLFWRSGDDAHALYAAAFSVKSRTLAWSAGPFPSQWHSTRTHFVVADDKMVVTDSQDNVRVLALGTGEELSVQTLEGGATVACPLEGEATRVLLRERTYTSDADGPVALDLGTRIIAAAPKEARCPYRSERSCDEKGAKAATLAGGPPCVVSGEVKSAKPKTPKAYAWGSYLLGDHELAIGRIGDGPRSVPFAWGWERGKKAVAWEAPLTVDGEAPHYDSPETVLRGGTLFTRYQNRAGRLIVTARAAASGASTWTREIDDTAEGSHVAAFDVKGGYVLVVVNQRVHVLDAATGAWLFALDATVT